MAHFIAIFLIVAVGGAEIMMAAIDSPATSETVLLPRSTPPMHLAPEDFGTLAAPTTTTSTSTTMRPQRIEHAQTPRAQRGTARSHRGYANAKECTSQVEHGGSYDRSSNPTHFGRYQFARSTWIANGGNPNTWGHATAQEQDEVFERTWNSPGGSQNWIRYNGC